MTVTVDPVFGCRIADGRRDRDGYVYEGTSRAHIMAWVRARGPVPEGMELDHACRRRACVAVHHLEPVTRTDNERRKVWRNRARRAKCAAGHDMATNRIVVQPEGGIVCRQCNRDAVG